MLLPKFTFHSPNRIEDALHVLAKQPEAAVLAGGTDLVVNMKKKMTSPKHVLSIQNIDALTHIREEKNHIRIGSCATACDILESKLLPETMRTLALSAKNLGSPLIRNRATIGGNIMSARPAADLICALLALDANIELMSSSEQRYLPLGKMLQGPGHTAAKSDEILTSVLLPKPAANTGSDYQSIGVRAAQDINLLNVSTVITLDQQKQVSKARVVLGCVGPTHILSQKASRCLLGQKITPELLNQAATAVKEDCAPIDDFRASAAYRLQMAGVLSKRALNNSGKQALNA